MCRVPAGLASTPPPTCSPGKTTPRWRARRTRLLVDLAGNTHRSEFSIDKLYSPDSPTGRLGLVEFRGFEMPPHWRMSATQALLLRILVARFWKKPYRHKLGRWGTEPHDRFMPHPTIGVHSPLVIDLIDTWTTRPSAAAPITPAIPVGAATTPSRSTPTKPSRAASTATRTGTTPPARSPSRPTSPAWPV